jgi:ribosomal protein S18
MSRKRAGTSAEEQRALRSAVKHARFMALVPYVGA